MTSLGLAGIRPSATAPSISAISLLYAFGLLMRQNKVLRIPVADVSDPATLRWRVSIIGMVHINLGELTIAARSLALPPPELDHASENFPACLVCAG